MSPGWIIHGLLWVAASAALAGVPAGAAVLVVALWAHLLAALFMFSVAATDMRLSLPPPPSISKVKALSVIGILCAAASIGEIWLAIASLTAHIVQLAVREHFCGKGNGMR